MQPNQPSMEKPEISKFSTHDFNLFRQAGTLSLTPKFQRREVWKTPARSYFIDSILKDIPIPPIILRVAQSEDRKKIIREVVDGQQRLKALFDFIDDKYALSKSLNNPLAGKRFSDLDNDSQDKINYYTFLCEVFSGISDSEVLEIFSRVNTYAVGLNAQELRNGRYFGRFKQSAYKLAFEHLEFWRRHKIFSEAGIARMLEVELTSELMVLQLDGQQDKKKSIDSFYAENDDEFDKREVVEKRFRLVLDTINQCFESSLAESEFRRSPLFYTLFCVVAHRMFGVKSEIAESEKRGRLNRSELSGLRDAALSLSDKITAFKQEEAVSKRDASFVAACLRQTDNIKPRKIRFSRLYKEAFLALPKT